MALRVDAGDRRHAVVPELVEAHGVEGLNAFEASGASLPEASAAEGDLTGEGSSCPPPPVVEEEVRS